METTRPFSEFEINPGLLKSLDDAGFKSASPIQEITIQPILEGKDIFAQAETGSGKTGSFAIPIIEQILRSNDTQSQEVLYVVLSPTRELAQQTHKVFTQFGKDLGVYATCLIGGESIEKQKQLLNKNPHILVATPGRLVDLIKQKLVSLNKCRGVVFDEADRLFDMGFQKDIEFALSKVPQNRQLIMVSATSNLEVLNTAYKFNSHPIELRLNEDSLLVENIDHKIAMVSSDEKMPLLVKMLRDHQDAYALIFCNTQIQTHSVAEWLKLMDFKAMPISGRLPQNKRTSLMKDFREKKVTILVCTDVAARGLDIKDVNLVINYDLPQEAANYVHRIGRTGRAGKSGLAISFCAHEDCENLDAIYNLIDAKIPKMELNNDSFATDICRKPYLNYKTLKIEEKSHNRNKPASPKSSPQAKKEQREKNTKQQEQTKKESNHMEQQKITSDQNRSRPMNTSRFFEITTSSKKQADKEAMNFLNINDQDLLGHEVLEEGSKKFIIFGPRKRRYKFYVKPLYNKLVTPFLIDVIHKAKLELNVNVSFKNPYVNIHFIGKDEGLLLKNRAELLKSFEQLTKAFLTQRIILPRSVKFSLRCGDTPFQERKENNRFERRPKSRGRNNEQRNENRQHRPRRERNPEQEKRLIDLIEKTKAKVLESKTSVTLDAMNPAERRIVHQYISDDSQFRSNSIGEGRFKKIEISLK